MQSIARCGMLAASILLLQGVAHAQLLNDAFPGDLDRELMSPHPIKVEAVTPPPANRAWPRTQQPVRPQENVTPVGYVHGAAAPLPPSVQNIVDYYGSGTSQRTLAMMANRPSSGLSANSAPAASFPAPRRTSSKPFQSSSPDPTISPYLNLFREETTSDLPNYYTFVRPQLQQQATNRHQQAELSRLRRQMQTTTYAGPGVSNGGVPATGHSTRFFNNSRYFPSATFAR